MVDAWRKFTLYQVNHTKEYFKSKLKLKGMVEKFNTRLPELLILNNIIVFAKCLKVTHKNNKYSILSNDIRKSDFINGLGNVYKFYSSNLQDALSFVESQNDSYELKLLIKNILESLIEGNNEDLCNKFIIKVHITTNIAITSCSYPKNKFKFLYHLLMSFGKFKCKNQLFKDNNMKRAFIKVGLFHEENLLVSKDNLTFSCSVYSYSNLLLLSVLLQILPQHI